MTNRTASYSCSRSAAHHVEACCACMDSVKTALDTALPVSFFTALILALAGILGFAIAQLSIAIIMIIAIIAISLITCFPVAKEPPAAS